MNAASTSSSSGYRRSFNWTLDHPARSCCWSSSLTLGLNVFLLAKVPKGFFPQQDTGAMTGGMQGPQDTSFYAMNAGVQQAVNIIKSDPGVQNVMGFTGGQGASPMAASPSSHSSRWKSARSRARIILNRLRPKLARHPRGAQTFLQPVQDIRIGGRQSSAQYQYTLCRPRPPPTSTSTAPCSW